MPSDAAPKPHPGGSAFWGPLGRGSPDSSGRLWGCGLTRENKAGSRGDRGSGGGMGVEQSPSPMAPPSVPGLRGPHSYLCSQPSLVQEKRRGVTPCPSVPGARVLTYPQATAATRGCPRRREVRERLRARVGGRASGWSRSLSGLGLAQGNTPGGVTADGAARVTGRPRHRLPALCQQLSRRSGRPGRTVGTTPRGESASGEVAPGAGTRSDGGQNQRGEAQSAVSATRPHGARRPRETGAEKKMKQVK